MEGRATVRDLLNTPYLKDFCTVVAGEKGLDRPVSWVHITGIHDLASQYIDGGELVLAISKEFAEKETALRFLKELIDKNVAALCIDTVLYYPKIDQDLIDLANQYDTPILELHKFARYLDISKGLNTLILNRQSALYRDADRYDATLAAMGISASVSGKIRYTAEYLNLDAAFVPPDGPPCLTAPELKNRLTAELHSQLLELKENEIFRRGNLLGKNIFVFHKFCGHLIFSAGQRPLTDFDEIVLSRLAINLRNGLIRETKEKELRLLRNQQWIEKWLSGLLDEKAVRASLRSCGFTQKFTQFYVCSILPVRKNQEDSLALTVRRDEIPENALLDTFLSGASILFRRACEEEKLITLTHVKDHIITCIILGRESDRDLPAAIESAVRGIQKTAGPYIDFSRSIFAVGKKVTAYSGIRQSLETSRQMLEAPELAKDGLILFDRQYCSLLFKKIDDPGFLSQFSEDQLGGLLAPENEILLQTLQIYYQNHCSKQQTADALFITRPTLYARLKKISEVLGADFERGEKRLACELAIHIRAFLESVSDSSPGS